MSDSQTRYWSCRIDVSFLKNNNPTPTNNERKGPGHGSKPPSIRLSHFSGSLPMNLTSSAITVARMASRAILCGGLN